MGFYDSAQKFQPMTQPIYNVKDMLLSGQAVGEALKGSSKLMQENAKAKQQLDANEYVSGLLGKATPENYQQQLLQAGSMSPYASPEMVKQIDTSRAGFQRGEDINRQLDRYAAEDAKWGAGHTLDQDRFGYTQKHDTDLMNMNKDQFNKEYGLKLKQHEFDQWKSKMSLSLQQKEIDAAQNQLLNKPTSALITTADGKQVVRDVPYSAVIQGGYKDANGKYVSIQSLDNVKATEEYTGIKTTKGAQQSAFAKIASDPQLFQDTLKKNLTSSIYGKQWITPDISDTKMKEMVGSAGALLKSDPRLQALYNNATTDAQRGAVIKQAAGLIQEDTNPFRRIGVGALNLLLPDEYEVDPYKIRVGDKRTKQNMQ